MTEDLRLGIKKGYCLHFLNYGIYSLFYSSIIFIRFVNQRKPYTPTINEKYLRMRKANGV